MTYEVIVPGHYVVFGSDLGMVAFIRVKDHTASYEKLGVPNYDPINVWGLSRWQGSIAYRTLGIPLKDWLARQKPGVQFRPDRDRTGWPLETT